MTKKHLIFAAAFFMLYILLSVSSNLAQTVRVEDLLSDEGIKKLLDKNKIPELGVGIISGGKLTYFETVTGYTLAVRVKSSSEKESLHLSFINSYIRPTQLL